MNKKTGFVILFLAAQLASAQTSTYRPPQSNGDYADRLAVCKAFGDVAVEAYKGFKEKPDQVDLMRVAHPIVDRLVTSLKSGIISDRDDAYRAGVAYCLDFIESGRSGSKSQLVR